MKLASLPKIKLAPLELFPDANYSEITPTFPLQLQMGFPMNPAE
jgi:hypothetical protein